MYLNDTMTVLGNNHIDYQVIDVSPGTNQADMELAMSLITGAGQSLSNFGIPAFILQDQNGMFYTRNGVQTPTQLLQWLKHCLTTTPNSSYFLSPLSEYPPH